jgi:Domain of unknown function (DUF2017)
MCSASTNTGCGPPWSTADEGSHVFSRPVKRTRSGRFQLNLSTEEREVLRGLPAELKQLIGSGTDDPNLRRLFPPAYPDDPVLEAEYERLVRDDLVAGRTAALDVMAKTVDATELDEAEMSGWLSAINDLRLVLGTQLDVSEDALGGDTPLDRLYQYLGYLEEMVVEALAGW